MANTIRHKLMQTIEKAIKNYQENLCKELDIIALYERNPVAHKWKVTYQSMCLRETVAWRFVDLIGQSWLLHQNGKALGARVLLRSAIETLSILILLNQITKNVVSGKIEFNVFMEKILTLLSGSRDGTTSQTATNIVTVLQKCELKYQGIEKLYAWLSESAHPNYEGMRVSYSETDQQNMKTTFVNRTNFLYSEMHDSNVVMAMRIFEHEYNTEWLTSFEALEIWLIQNDELLSSKNL